MRVALGDDWIVEASSVETQKFASPLLRTGWHPIGEAFGSPGASQIVEMLELAAYLKSLAPTPRLNQVLPQLKSDYRHSFLQLSTAFRLRAIGLEIDSFEPPTNKGRAGDISIVNNDACTIVECYAPRGSEPNRAYDLLRLGDVMDRFSASPVRVDIRLKADASHADRKQLAHYLSTLAIPVVSTLSWGDKTDRLRCRR